MLPACLFLLLVLLPSMPHCDPTADTSPVPSSPWTMFCPIACSCNLQQTALAADRTLRRAVDCTNSGLTALPSNVSQDTEALLLGRNRIRPIQLTRFQSLYNLTVLDLSSNQIYSLEDWGLESAGLLYLALDHNDIDYLPNSSFTGARALRSMSLTNNKIEIIHNNALLGLTRLKTLNLSHNRLFAINSAWFRDLTSLDVLDLSENNIHVLRDRTFAHLRSMRTLILSGNMVKNIYDDAFMGIELLQHLLLDNNRLHQIPPKPWQQFYGIQTINLCNNHIPKLDSGSFENINVSRLQLSGVKTLRLVDRHAFINLPSLQTLELADNPALIYLDRQAFFRLPKLHTLDLHNSNLSTIEEDILTSLPSLSMLQVQGNPLICDCTLSWLARELHTGRRNINFTKPEELSCSSSQEPKTLNLASSDAMGHLSVSCEPRILPLFEQDYETVLGERMEWDCRAVGVPVPQIDWLLPTHPQGELNDEVTVLKSGSMDDPEGRVAVSHSGTLSISYVQGGDHGQYKCLASNPKGRDERTTHLHIKNMRANVIIMHVTDTSITFTWRNAHYAHDYQILYKQSNTNHTYQTVDIRPYMRSYTASELYPQTQYELCIAVKHEGISMPLNCTHISTRTAAQLKMGIVNARNYILGGGIGCLLAMVVLVYGVAFAVRRYNQKKRQREELYGDNLSQLFLASIDSMSDTTPITYENRGAVIFDDDDIDEIRSSACTSETSSIK